MATTAQPTDALKLVFEKTSETYVLKVLTSPDRLKIFVEIKLLDAVENASVDPKDIFEVLQQVAPKAKLDDPVIHDLCKQLNAENREAQRRVAKGEPPLAGKDGRLVFLVKRYDPGTEQRAEVVDPRFLKTFDNVEKGAVIARILPPTPGEAGIDAFGDPIPPTPGKEINCKVDASIEIAPIAEGSPVRGLVAKQSGYATLRNGTFSVCHELVVEGDVGFKTGDLDFIGIVKIRGSALKDFSVFAREDIEIEDNVLHGMLVSRHGSIKVKGYIAGNAVSGIIVSENANEKMIRSLLNARNSQVRAAKEVTVGILDGVSVEAVGHILIEKESRNSFLRSRGTVRLPDGHLFGGEVHAVCGLEAKFLGNDSAALTRIFVCSDIESTAEYAVLMGKIASVQAAQDLLRMQLGTYADNQSRISRLNAGYRQKIELMLSQLKRTEDTKQALYEERDALIKDAHHNTVFRVNVLGKAYPGLEIIDGEEKFTLDSELNGPVSIQYTPEDKKFSIESLQPLFCSNEEQKEAEAGTKPQPAKKK